jgi:hypothetical protein
MHCCRVVDSLETVGCKMGRTNLCVRYEVDLLELESFQFPILARKYGVLICSSIGAGWPHGNDKRHEMDACFIFLV